MKGNKGYLCCRRIVVKATPLFLPNEGMSLVRGESNASQFGLKMASPNDGLWPTAPSYGRPTRVP